MRKFPNKNCKSSRQVGIDGESLASQWYQDNGYGVVARNWSCREGELDLVAVKSGLIVFCEVKSRSSNRFGSPLEAVTPVKQHRIRRLAAKYLAIHQVRGEVRFDVVGVSGNSIEVVEGAF